MRHLKVVLDRPSTDEPFFRPTVEQRWHFEDRYMGRGVTEEVTLGVDGLTKVTQLMFPTEQLWAEYQADPVLREQREQALAHNKAHGIVGRRRRPISEAALRTLQDELCSPEYRRLNKELHGAEPEYGALGCIWAGHVNELARAYRCSTILDYGCGKRALQRDLVNLYAPYMIFNYDPGVPGLDELPKPRHLVACIDVLEHVEPDSIDMVVDHLAAMTQRVAFLAISLEPSKRTLEDGRNAHLLVKPTEWWVAKLMQRFKLKHLHDFDGRELTLALEPKL